MKIESSVHFDTDSLVEVDIYEPEGCLACELFGDLFDALDYIEPYKRMEGPMRIEIMIGGFVTFRWQKGEFK